MVPCDADNIAEEYKVLLNEVKLYNPDLIKTPRLLAITKADLIDQELQEEIEVEIKQDKEMDQVEYLFISAIAQQGLIELKDKLWAKLTDLPAFMKEE